MNEIVIGTTNVSIKEYKGQRVVTLSDIDTVHGRPKGTARKRFNDNKGHFIYGEDYFKVQPSENRTVGIASPNGGIVLTESGYLMIVKSFTDNKAWDVQRALVKSYFRAKQEKPPQYEQLKLEEKPYEYIDKFYKGQPVLSSADIEHFSGINHTRIDYALRNVCTEHKDYEYIADDKLVEFKKENPKYMRSASRLFVIFKSGFDKLVRHFGIKCETPKIMIEDKKKSARGVVNEATCNLMHYIRRELKGVESLTYLLESAANIDDLNTFRSILVRKLKAIGGWELDTSSVRLEIHSPSCKEETSIFEGNRGMRF